MVSQFLSQIFHTCEVAEVVGDVVELSDVVCVEVDVTDDVGELVELAEDVNVVVVIEVLGVVVVRDEV